MTGFFSRVSRYAKPALAEQRENRLTEIFAAVLERADGLALELARLWLSTRPPEGAALPVRELDDAREALADQELILRHPVVSQRFTAGGDFVDLELRFGSPGEPPSQDVVLWVEVKHGASPHEHQLRNYLDDIERLDVRAGAVVLLAPRWSYPFLTPEPPPPEVWQRTWQETASRCQRWARRADGVTRFLVDEFLAYLREENLMDAEVITPLQLVALAEYPLASEGMALICQEASRYIQASWNDPAGKREGRSGKPDYGLGYWETYPQAPRGETPPDWTPAWWDWNLKRADWEMEESRGGVPVFVAGVSARRDQTIVTREAAGWAAALAERYGFERVRDDCQRFERVAYPEEVLVGRTLQQQAGNLGDWVVETYRALYEAGPPPGIGVGNGSLPAEAPQAS